MSKKKESKKAKAKSKKDPKPNAKKDLKGFIKQTSTALSLGVAVVGANAVSQFVKAFVNGLITPAIDLVMPKGDYQNLIYKVNGSEFLVGDFISAAINMVIISIIIYLYAKYVAKDEKVLEKAKLK